MLQIAKFFADYFSKKNAVIPYVKERVPLSG